jgi:hypothetical protein
MMAMIKLATNRTKVLQLNWLAAKACLLNRSKLTCMNPNWLTVAFCFYIVNAIKRRSNYRYINVYLK